MLKSFAYAWSRFNAELISLIHHQIHHSFGCGIAFSNYLIMTECGYCFQYQQRKYLNFELLTTLKLIDFFFFHFRYTHFT